MAVVGKRFRKAEPAHDKEGNLIDNAGLGSLAAVLGLPGCLPVLLGRHSQLIAKFEYLPQRRHIGTKGAPGCRIAAFEQNVGRRYNRFAPGFDLLLSCLRQSVPLIGRVPLSNQPHGVQKHDTHG
jgi:hypothetical protein